MGKAHEEGGGHMKFRTKKLLALALLMLWGLTGVAEDAPLTGNAGVIDDGMIPDIPISNDDISLPDIDFDDNLFNPDTATTDILHKGSEEPDEPTEAIEANANAIRLGVNETYKLNTKKLGKKLTFKSSKPKVASVSKKGVVKGVKKGTAVITVMSGQKVKAKYAFKVMAKPKKVTLNKTKLTMMLYDEVQLKAKLPAGSASNKLIWKSSDEDVVTVFEDGWLFADDVGTATITVKTYNGKKATCKVKVVGDEPEPEPTPKPTSKPTTRPTTEPTPTPTPTPVPTPTPDPIIVSENDININVDERYSVKVAPFPYDSSVSWESSDKSVATCEWSKVWNNHTTDLFIIGKKAGTAIITVKNVKTNDSVKISVTVIDNNIQLQLPDTPITIGDYSYGGDLKQKYDITDISYTYERRSSGDYKIVVSFAGIKTYDYQGANQSSTPKIGLKLYDSYGAVIDSGIAKGPSLAMDERWSASSCSKTFYDIPAGSYTLKVLSTN